MNVKFNFKYGKTIFLHNIFIKYRIINRIPLYNKEFLDFSLNFKFLKKMAKQYKNLKPLYSKDNKINDISPLIKYSKIGSKKENKSNNENLVNDEIMLKY